MKLDPRTWFKNSSSENQATNKFYEQFYKMLGGTYTSYDPNRVTYIDKGYNINPTVYSVVSQKSRKSSSVPYCVRKIEDKAEHSKLKMFQRATGNDLTIQQKVKKLLLESKAYEDKGDIPFPMDKPNPNQTWVEVIELYNTFMDTTGNFYLYMFAPTEGMNAGQPIEVYVLPSQYTEIVLKNNSVDVKSMENPIDHYLVIVGGSYVEFEQENVIHVKLPNPNFSSNGEHLYGQAPLSAALRNIQSSNTAIDLNNKTLKSGGAYGLIHGKQTPLAPEQAKQVKDRLVEMSVDESNLAKITAVTHEMGFTRLSLTTAEMQPFEYLNYDQKQICNVLGWDDKLLNNDGGSNYGAYLETVRKRVITDTIMPSLKLLASALNDEFLPRFKGYENTELIFDASELPEMQTDMKELVSWLNDLLDRGVINRAEYRMAINYTGTELPIMQEYTVSQNTIKLEDALNDDFNIE